jgi:endonuclease G
LEIPVRIHITVDDPRRITVAMAQRSEPWSGESLEAMREPAHDANYGDRGGYDQDFLNTPGLPNVRVPMPAAADPDVLAQTNAGQDILHYQHFWVRMHAKRRLALVAASNVTGEHALRRPNPRKEYTRAALSGLAKNDIEKWFLDPRLDERFQLPDAFFTKDWKALTRGTSCDGKMWRGERPTACSGSRMAIPTTSPTALRRSVYSTSHRRATTTGATWRTTSWRRPPMSVCVFSPALS